MLESVTRPGLPTPSSSQAPVSSEPECCLMAFCRRIYEFIVNLICCCFQREEPRTQALTQPTPPPRPVTPPQPLPEGTRPGLPEEAYIFNGNSRAEKDRLHGFLVEHSVILDDIQLYSFVSKMYIRWGHLTSIQASDQRVGCIVSRQRSVSVIVPAFSELRERYPNEKYEQPPTVDRAHNFAYFTTDTVSPPTPGLPEGAFHHDPENDKTDEANALKRFIASHNRSASDLVVERLLENMAENAKKLKDVGYGSHSVGCIINTELTDIRACVVVPAYSELANLPGYIDLRAKLFGNVVCFMTAKVGL